MEKAIDRLIDKIKEMNNPTVIGLDPRYEIIPNCIKNKYSQDLEGASKAIIEWNKALIDNVCDIIPAVKPQIAFYEMFGMHGMYAFEETCKYAKEKGMLVIADMKRGDIGTTAKAYSNAAIGTTPIGDKELSVYDADFVTVNPYLGSDGVLPFVEDCEKYGKGIFILVKTSNKSSGDLQDIVTEDGEKIYEKMAQKVNEWGKELVGKYGYSSVSAVVGATYPEQLKELRKTMPKSYFLIPGYGAQGGKAEDIALGFDENGLGGIVNASRSLICAYKSDLWKDKYNEEQFAEATRAEAIRMRDELNAIINKK